MSLEFEVPLISLIFMIILIVIYFGKTKINLPENKMYETILICSLFEIIINTVIHFICALTDFNTLNIVYYDFFNFLNKILSTLFVIIFASLFSYTVMITYESVRKNSKKFISKIVVIEVVFAIITLFTNITLIKVGTVTNVNGLTIQLGYFMVALFLIATLVVTLKNIKKIDRRYYVIFIMLFISGFLYTISLLFPGILIYDLLLVILCYIMYFTIENPDIKLLDELSKSKELAEKYNNDKSIFLFNMTQQIRRPLNIIEQNTEKLLESEYVDDIEDEIFELKNAQKRISHIINGVLDVSTIDAKKIKIVENQYNVRNLLKEISIRAERAAADKNLEFRKNFDEGLPELLYGDSIRIKQIINAIITNSVKYTEKGFIELNVNSIVTFDVCRLIISIKDSGIGIKTEEINKLFEKKDDKELDLSKIDDKEITLDIAKKMVNLVGGTITVQSEKNKGSEFTIVIDERIVNDNTKIAKLVEDYKTLNEKNKILFVSDDKTQSAFYKKRLESSYSFEIANSGQECLNRIRKKEEFDVIIISKNMEKLDGLTVMEKLKGIDEFDIPVILLVDKDDDKKGFAKYKFSAVITTNSTEQQLKNKIDSIIRK